MKSLLAALFLILMPPSLLLGQDYTTPNVKKPDKAILEAILARTSALDRGLAILSLQGVRDPILADVEVYLKAAQWIQRHDEYFAELSGRWTIEVLERGLLRAAQAARGDSPWLHVA